MWRQEDPSECNESDESALPLQRGPRAFKTFCRFFDSDAKLYSDHICIHILLYIYVCGLTGINMGLDYYSNIIYCYQNKINFIKGTYLSILTNILCDYMQIFLNY